MAFSFLFLIQVNYFIFSVRGPLWTILFSNGEKSPDENFEKTFKKGVNKMLYFTIGVLVGAILNALWQHLIMGHGTLRIDRSDPEKDVYRLEIDNLDQIDRKNRLYVKVDHHADLSQN